jgi:cell division protein FtsB
VPQRLVKQMVRKLIGWYVRFLGHQVGILGQATGRFALAAAERLERLEATQSAEREAMAAQIAALEARVAELEARTSTPPEPEVSAGTPES